MGSLVTPKLRPLPARPAEIDGRRYVQLDDPFEVAVRPIFIPFELFRRVVRRFDGRSTVGEICEQVRRETGEALGVDEVEHIVRDLDRAYALDGPAFAAFKRRYAEGRVRTAAFAGASYRASATGLREQLRGFYQHQDGAGPPAVGHRSRTDPRALRGIVSPHIDFARGGPTYTWAYRALLEAAEPDVVVVLGVAHQPCSRRFALTRKHFETPLGVLSTAGAYLDAIVERAGADLFDDELAHRTEHSVEFQAVFLQHAFEGRRAPTIVPILVGSFHDLMEAGVDPIEDDEVGRFVEALRLAEASSGQRVVYVGGIDLCHVGPEFGDPNPVDVRLRERVRAFDLDLLARASEGDARGWFERAAAVENRWRVCGLSATYTMLQAIAPARGRLLRYNQAVDPRGDCCVSFASMSFEDAGG